MTASPDLNADDELAAEIEKEHKVAERFVSLFERNPRERTSLAEAYGIFVERGKLDKFVAHLANGAEAAAGSKPRPPASPSRRSAAGRRTRRP